MKAFQVSMGKGAKIQGNKMEQTLKRHADSHRHSPRQTTGQITGAEFQTSKFKKVGTQTAIQSSLCFRGTGPPGTNTSFTHYSLLGYITRAHTQKSHVHCRVELCIKYIIHGRQETCGMRKVPSQVSMGLHMPVTVCVRMFCVRVCLQACDKSNSLIPCSCHLGQHTTNTKQRGSILLSR